MSQDKQSVMEKFYNDSFRVLNEGDIVKGRIVAFNEKEAVVDIGFKSEGFVSIEEFRNLDSIDLNKEIDVLIESIEDEEGRLVLSRMKAERLRGWMKLGDTINEGDSVEGRVVKQVKAGFTVDGTGLKAFLPTSLNALKGVSTHDILAGKNKCPTTKNNRPRRNMILSRREVVQKEKEKIRERVWN